MKWWKGEITRLLDDMVLVYGANPEFRNGFGAALFVRNFGAKPYGGGRGIVGQTYGLVTKNLKEGFVELLKDGTKKEYPKAGRRSVSLEDISDNIRELYTCASENPDKRFIILYKYNSDNLNGYDSVTFIKLFKNHPIPKNIYFHESFKGIM